MTCQSETHSRSDYNRKICTCEQGRRANTEYVARKKAEHKARTTSETTAYRAAGGTGGLPSLPHGKASTKEWKGCDCLECTNAARQRSRNTSSKHRFLQRVRANQERIAS